MSSYISGFRGDDCGFCPPGLPGGKGERGDSGKRSYEFFKPLRTVDTLRTIAPP